MLEGPENSIAGGRDLVAELAAAVRGNGPGSFPQQTPPVSSQPQAAGPHVPTSMTDWQSQVQPNPAMQSSMDWQSQMVQQRQEMQLQQMTAAMHQMGQQVEAYANLTANLQEDLANTKQELVQAQHSRVEMLQAARGNCEQEQLDILRRERDDALAKCNQHEEDVKLLRQEVVGYRNETMQAQQLINTEEERRQRLEGKTIPNLDLFELDALQAELEQYITVQLRSLKLCTQAKEQRLRNENSSSDTMDRIVDELKCPLTKVLFSDPVMAVDGYTYERKAIQGWFREHGATSPSTHQKLESDQLISNRSIQKLMGVDIL